MVVSVEDIWAACNIIATQDNLDVTVTESLKAAVIGGGCIFACSLLMGPIGIGVGAALGGVCGMTAAKGHSSLITVLQNMRPEEKNRLGQHLLQVVQRLEISDGAMLMAIAMDPTSPGRAAVRGALGTYLHQNWD